MVDTLNSGMSFPEIMMNQEMSDANRSPLSSIAKVRNLSSSALLEIWIQR